jgi:CheY-like chemotaxis protein
MTHLADSLGQSKPTVLVVDDTPENLQVMNGLLRGLYKVRLATSGGLALELALQTPQPDLILLDILMAMRCAYGLRPTPPLRTFL